MDCSHRLYCAASVPVSILRGVRDEAKDLLAVIEKTSRCGKYFIKCLFDGVQPKKMDWNGEYLERRWSKCSGAGLQALDSLAASIIRPFAVVSDVLKFTLGIIEPSAAIRPFSFDENMDEAD